MRKAEDPAGFQRKTHGFEGPIYSIRSTKFARKLSIALTCVALSIGVGFHSAAMALVLGDVPAGGDAGGKFGEVVDWPLIPIHMALLPDGRVISYGANTKGEQGALYYDIWDPKTGTHTTLPNTTPTDIFCGSGTLLGEGANGKFWLSGMLGIVGGDLTINGVRNYSNQDANLFDPATNSLLPVGTMQFPRWYPTLMTLSTGEKLLIGGRRDPSEYYAMPGPSPEIFSTTKGWRTLSGVYVNTGFIPPNLFRQEWYYPKVGIGKDATPYLFTQAGIIYKISTADVGLATDSGAVRLEESSFGYPMAQLPNPYADPSSPNYDPATTNFVYLSLRQGKKAVAVDLATDPPTIIPVPDLNMKRVWGNLTVLADGKLLASGGSADDESGVLTDPSQVQIPAMQSEIFDASIGTWTLGASSQRLRLYHSSALLLPDGSVLTGGGGAPGPVVNHDAEVYYPPYLYDAAGNPKSRPKIVTAPATVRYGQAFRFQVGAGDVITKVRLVQLGFVTHGYNPDQHYFHVPFSQTGTSVVGQATSDPAMVPPGYYMLFVFNQDNTPSIAAIVSVPPLYD